MAGKTVTPVSIAFGWDGSKLNSGLKESREAISTLRQNLKASVSDIDRYDNEIAILTKHANELSLSEKRLAEAKDYIAKKYKIETDEARRLREQVEALDAATRAHTASLDKYAKRRDASRAMVDREISSVEKLAASIQRVNALERMGKSQGGLSDSEAKSVIGGSIMRATGYVSPQQKAQDFSRMQAIMNDALSRGAVGANDAAEAMEVYAKSIGHVTEKMRQEEAAAKAKALADQQNAIAAEQQLKLQQQQADALAQAAKTRQDLLDTSKRLSSQETEDAAALLAKLKEINAVRQQSQLLQTNSFSAQDKARASAKAMFSAVGYVSEAEKLDRFNQMQQIFNQGVADGAGSASAAARAMEHYAKSIGYATQQMKDRDKFSLRRKASGEMFDASRTGAQRLDRSIDRVDALERIGGGSGGLSGGQATAVRQNLLNKELGYRSAANAAAEYARMERIVGDMVMRGQYSITDATRAMRQYATAIGHVTAEQRLRNREERHRTSAKEIIDETRTAVDKYRRSIAELNAMLRRGNIDQRTHARGVRDARNRYASESQQNPNFWQRVQRSMVPDKHLQAIGTFGLPMAVGAGIKKAFDLTANLQVAEKSFEVMTNSSGAAKRLIGDMRALDRASLLNFQSITKAGQTMMGFGVETSDVMPIMTSLSDISMGNSERMEKLSLAMGQVRASGKLAGTELLQLINAGFNPLQEIARTTGKSMPELLQAMHDKKISWEQVKDAVQSATAEGGRFFNMTKELEKTAAGSMAKFVSDLQIIGMDIGERIVPGLTKMMEIFNGIPGSPGGSFFSWLAGQTFDGLGYLAAGMKDIASGDMSFGGVAKAMEEAQYRDLERIEKLKDGLAQSSSDMFLKSIKSELEKQKMTMEQYADVFSSNSGMQEKLKFQFQEIFGLEKGYRAFQMFAEQMKQLDSDAKDRQAKEQLQIVSDNDKRAFDRLDELQKEKAKLLEKEETLADKIAALRKMEKDLQMSAEGKQNIQKSIDLLREIDRIEKKKEANQKRLEQEVGFQQEDTVLRAISARARQGVGIENTTTSLGEWATFATKQSFDAVRQEMIQSLGNRRLANEAFAKFKEAAELAKQQYKDQQKQDAKDIFMSQLSSQEKAAVRFAKLSKLLDDKLITQQEFDKEKASLEQQVFEETWGNGAVMVPALRAGTVEAYKYLAESKQRDEEKKIFQKQLDLQKTSKDLLQKIADREFGIE